MIGFGARWATLALSGVLALSLIGCGEPPAASVSEQEAVQASPVGSPFPDARVTSASEITVTLANGKILGERIVGDIGQSVVLNITGDGSRHELSIEGLVEKQAIAAQGQTTVSFTIDGDPRDVPITIDGNRAGTFVAQLPGGISDE